TILGWLYGNGNFGKSICIAAGCGEDADCTAATLGSILGIFNGLSGLPDSWVVPLGRNIKTISINLADGGLVVPKTIDELTERVLRLTPIFLGSRFCDTVNAENGYSILTNEPSDLYNKPKRLNSYAEYRFEALLKQQPFSTKHSFTLFDVVLDYGGDPYIIEAIPRKFKLIIENNIRMQQWLEIKWYLPETWTVSPSDETGISLEQYHGNIGRLDIEFEITPIGLNRARYDLVLEIRSNGRHTKGLVPLVLINGSE
ncbi:MAG: ADP-ribosylglycohydrolase family protein, partial [Clostridiaceae bacterium]|nr:ADP-ribosylglycohydrolase family protein [Clostridiaceae bacterium]